MKARIEKKLSKRLVEIAPSIFSSAWLDNEEPSGLAYAQGSRVSNIWSVGGGVDYSGEGEDWYTAWSHWKSNFEWHIDCKVFPEGDRFAGLPDIRGIKQTPTNLLCMAAEAEMKHRAKYNR